MLTRPFVTVLVITLIGFAGEQMLRPVIPLITIDRGGGVVLVGMIAAAHSLPSIFFRPLIGRLVDSWRHTHLLRLGAIVITAGPAAVMAPGLLALTAARFIQGTGWAIYSVSTQTLMAKLAPADRRGEASGYYQAMPAIATLIGPSIGITLYLAVGEIGPVLVAMALFLVAVWITWRIAAEPRPAAAIPRRDDPATGTGPRGFRSLLRAIAEPSAVPMTVILTTFLSAQSLFIVFPPVYAATIGASLGSLALYYPAYGVVLVASQLFGGRVSDRFGRGPAIRIGCALGAVGLLIAGLGDTLLTLGIGAAVYGVAASTVTPTLSALTMDRAPANRIGSAMATYSIGYQLATGASSIVWGLVIAAGGFGWAFVAAIALQAVTAAGSVGLTRTGRRLVQ